MSKTCRDRMLPFAALYAGRRVSPRRRPSVVGGPRQGASQPPGGLRRERRRGCRRVRGIDGVPAARPRAGGRTGRDAGGKDSSLLLEAKARPDLRGRMDWGQLQGIRARRQQEL